MEDIDDKSAEDFLKKVLSPEELSDISEDVAKKIQSAVQDSFEDFLTRKALFETCKCELETNLTKVEKEFAEKCSVLANAEKRLKDAEEESKEVEKKYKEKVDEVNLLKDNAKRSEVECTDFKRQRDVAVDEREGLLQMVERREAELQRLKENVSDLSLQLSEAVTAKCSALQNAEELESLKISLEYREKRFEQETSLLQKQVETLTEELSKRTRELLETKNNSSSRFVTLESKLSQKTEELKVALDSLSDLRETNQQLIEKNEGLLERMRSQKEYFEELQENQTDELNAQTKLAKLYKGICDENEEKTKTLTESVNELQKLLRDAADQYGQLETTHREVLVKNLENLAKKDKCIELLKKELVDANELLKATKQENLESVVENMSPCAAAASRLIKSGMTLTQIYTQYATVSEQLLFEREENRKLNLYISTIVKEIEEKAPILKQERLDYERALENVECLTKQMDKMIAETNVMQYECVEAKKLSAHYERENERLKKERVDLSRQVCYLIKCLEEARGDTVVSDFDSSYVTCENEDERGGSAQYVISKKLVTFSSIEELQANNEKLLSLVRKLSLKHEESENVSLTEHHDVKAKAERLESRLSDLMDEMERQSKMMELMSNQCKTYKTLYEQLLHGRNEAGVECNPDDGNKLTPVKGNVPFVTSTPFTSATSATDSQEVTLLKNKLKEVEAKLRKLESDNVGYCLNLQNKEQKLTEELEDVRSQLNEARRTNTKLLTQAEYHEEKFKLYESNVRMYKKQIQALEEKNNSYNSIIASNEKSIVDLKNETFNVQCKLSKYEITVDSLRQENYLLKSSEARLTQEIEGLKREKHGHSLLMANLDSIKATFARSESEGKLKLENQLDSVLKECDALRLKLREEQDNFKLLSKQMRRETDLAKERMEEEKKLADKARQDLVTLQTEIDKKNLHVEEVEKKLKELMNKPVKDAIDVATALSDTSKKMTKELEEKVGKLESEVASLERQLKAAKQHGLQYSEMAEVLEKQVAQLEKNQIKLKQDTDDKLEKAEKKELEMRDKFALLEVKYNDLVKNQDSSRTELSSQLSGIQRDLDDKKELVKKLEGEVNVMSQQLQEAREKVVILTDDLQAAEEKYSNELVQRSENVKELSKMKTELIQYQHEVKQLKHEEENARERLREGKKMWEEQEVNYNKEINVLKEQIVELNEQNCALHDSLQELGSQVALLKAQVTDSESSIIADNTPSSSTSSHVPDELLKIIKFLRQEKNVAVTKTELLRSENARVKSQMNILEKELENCKSDLQTAKNASQVIVSSAAKHSELLRKVETLNAVTDSNRLLREERNELVDENRRLKQELSDTKNILEPLKNQEDKLKEEMELMSAENQELKAEALRWRQRVNTLIERSNMTTPEDWRRLTNERENLAKMYQTEKNNSEKLEEKLQDVVNEKKTLEETLRKTNDNLQSEGKELERLRVEINDLKSQVTANKNENLESKTKILQLEETISNLNNQLLAKDAVITDVKSKEAQIRKIAKKYKIQCEELVKQQEEEKKKREEEEAARTLVVPVEEQQKYRTEGKMESAKEFEEKIRKLELGHSERIKELDNRVTSTQEEMERLRTSSNEKEERAKQVIKNARTKIYELTELKNNLESELKSLKGQSEHSRDESDAKINSMKTQYENMISAMEKERLDLTTERNQERDRLSGQVNSLMQQISQLQRRIDNQQASKPSTSSGPVEMKNVVEPPTANIKPMSGPSSSGTKQSTAQQSVAVGPWRSGNETPFASIRPIPMQTRTAAVLPTSQTSASQTSSAQAMVPPQQQLVHTTGSGGEVLSSSPTSSHTDYMPATSSAPAIRQAAVAPTLVSLTPPTGSDAQSTQEMEAEVNESDLQQSSSSQGQTQGQQQQQTQAHQQQPNQQQQQQQQLQPQALQTALVLPRVEQVTTQQQQQQSSQASSSNTVTTTQAGLKRQRDVEGREGEEAAGKIAPQSKRSRVTGTTELFHHHHHHHHLHHKVTHSSGSEVEYQVPTSSQRDQEDDSIIMVDSEEEGNLDDADVEELDDEPEFEEDNGEGYGGYSRDDQDMGMANFDEGPDIDEENTPDQDSNEVEVIEDSSEVPNQSSSRDGPADNCTTAAVPESVDEEQQIQQTSEATSTGPVTTQPSSGNNIVVVSHAASSQSFRTRTLVPPLSRQQQQQQQQQQSYEDQADDSIVPSTPTLFVPRRCDGFGEAVSSPQVPHQARFTFSDPTPPATRTSTSSTTSVQLAGDGATMEEVMSQLDEGVVGGTGTGRSVPTTPLQVSPQELPASDTTSLASGIPDITVTAAGDDIDEDDEDEDEAESMRPPEVIGSIGVGDEAEATDDRSDDVSGYEPEIINIIDDENDGVTSEGEKPLSAGATIDEGREAEASEPFDTTGRRPIGRLGGNSNIARRSGGRRLRMTSQRPEPGSSSPSPIGTILNMSGGDVQRGLNRNRLQQRQRQRSWR